MINLKIGQKLQLEIERMGINGEGIGVISGRLVFIPYALPGEEVLVEITENARNFSRAKLVKIIEKSPNRVKPQDRAYHEMSQSHIMHLSYPMQLEFKRDVMRQALGVIMNCVQLWEWKIHLVIVTNCSSKCVV